MKGLKSVVTVRALVLRDDKHRERASERVRAPQKEAAGIIVEIDGTNDTRGIMSGLPGNSRLARFYGERTR